MNAIKFEAARVCEPSLPLLFKLPNSWGRLRDKVIGGAPYDDLYAEGSARKGYLYQASGIWKGLYLTTWII